MAKAKAKIHTKTKHVVRLTLTEAEAATLRQVCANIGGTFHTPRRHMTAISRALDIVDIRDPGHPLDRRYRSLYFLEPDGSSRANWEG